MARSFGRVFTAIWDDEDFRVLSPTAQRMYLFLLSQADLEHSGLIPLRERRWARACGALAVSQVTDDLKELEAGRFVVIDEETEELLVRSLLRRDEVWKQPNVFKAAAASAMAAKSSRIKSVLHAEVSRLDFSGANEDSRRVREGLLRYLEPFASLSRTLREGFAKGSPVAQGEGEGGTGNGRSVGASPFPEPPPPATGARHARRNPPSPVLVPGEEDQDPGQDPADLIAEIRSVRPDWSTKSIERALSAQAVRERPWPLVCAAALAMAHDPESQQPGRLAHDGPWWHQAVRPPAEPPPPWCGSCDEKTRLTNDDNPRRCPACHPLREKS